MYITHLIELLQRDGFGEERWERPNTCGDCALSVEDYTNSRLICLKEPPVLTIENGNLHVNPNTLSSLWCSHWRAGTRKELRKAPK